MRKRIAISISVIILLYAVFTLGMVYEVTGGSQISTIDTPFSIAFSNERIGFVGIYNQDDVTCAKWVLENTDSSLLIQVDYLGMSLIIETGGYDRPVYVHPKGKHYLFLHTWNIEHDRLVYGWLEASREYEVIPDLTNAKEIYRQGKAVVYEIES